MWPDGTKPGACFVAGTLIACPGRFRRIEEIQSGDIVLTWNPLTNELLQTQVEKLDIHKDLYEVLTLESSKGEKIQVTLDHPFYQNGKWVSSGDLVMDGSVFSVFGGRTESLTVSLPLCQTKTVFNLQTKTGTYLVGEAGFLVSGQVLPREQGNCPISNHLYAAAEMRES